MYRSLRTRLVAPALLGTLLGGLALPGSATAQAAGIEQQRQAVFQQMLANPTDRALMTEYARLSVELRDFEAAAATLERLVDLEPGNAAARVELAIAYFSLGNYDLAEYHMDLAQNTGSITAEDARLIQTYLAAATEQDQPNRLSGQVALGYAHSQEADEGGLFGSVGLTWRLDMGGADAEDWVTQFSYATIAQGQDDDDGRAAARLRTGPEFRLTGDAYGPRLQPYLELEAQRGDDDADGDSFNSYAIGAAYQNPISALFTTYADLTYGMGQSTEGTPDFTFAEIDLGLVYRPSRDTRLRLTLSSAVAQFDDNSPDESVNTLRLEAQHQFDTGLDLFERRWVVGAYGAVETTEGGLDDEDATRRALGLLLRAFVTRDIFVETSATRLSSSGDLGGGATGSDETLYSIQLGWEF